MVQRHRRRLQILFAGRGHKAGSGGWHCAGRTPDAGGKLKEVQKLAEQGVSYAQDIFKSIGVYLGHTLCLYEMFYDIRNLIVLGRVASGVGGDLIVAECQRVLSEEYPELSQKLRVMLPDEEFRRVGQSMAAASLPEV